MESLKLIGWAAATAIAAAAALAAAGCTRRGEEIELWTMQLAPDFNEYFSKAIREFERAHPGARVRWTDVPFDAMGQRLVAASVAGQLPDVLNLNADLLTALAKEGRLVDISREAPAAKSEFLEGAWEAGRVGDGVYALPWYVAVDVLFWREDLFTKSGLGEADVPRTFADLPRVAQALRTKADVFALAPKLGSDSDLLRFFLMEGAPALRDGEVDFSDARCGQVASFWAERFARRECPRSALTLSHRVGLDLYIRGEVAMLLSGPQFLQIIQENDPRIAAATRVAPPMLGAAGVTNLAVMNVAVSADSPRRERALAFARALTSAPAQLEFCRTEACFPSALAALEDPMFTHPSGEAAARARAIAVTALRSARSLVAGLQRQSDAMRLQQIALQEIVFDGAPVRDALERAEKATAALAR
ncbi:MAG: extracellular solute-binding protein [Planctomycetes bacterium]|nr:extracellular solute-binding protein [Planctomycetota bacterium]